MESCIRAVLQALQGVLELVVRLALPLALGIGVVVVVLVFGGPRQSFRLPWPRLAGYGLIGLTTVALWGVLRTASPRARQELAWRESTEATTNPLPDAPGLTQFAPALAILAEHTYTRNLTLPPGFFQRIGAEGLGVLAPYLSDPSADNVLRLVDTFKRSGSDVIFTRQVTRLDEEPFAFATSSVRVQFDRLAGRAYDAHFEAHYSFQNNTGQPLVARFVFPLPDRVTVRDLAITVGGEAVGESRESEGYVWKKRMEPGETKEAVVTYRAQGARTWQYDLGSRRRRVQQFTLDALPGGSVRFLRGSLQPTSNARSPLHWTLTNVVTAQQIALAFPPDVADRDGYLQALTALPASLAVFLLGALALIRRPAGAVLAGVLLFGLGLVALPVVANYTGTLVGTIVTPLLGAALAVRVLGKTVLLAALPAALLPGAFLSPEHTGLLVLLLLAVPIALLLGGRVKPAPGAPLEGPLPPAS